MKFKFALVEDNAAIRQQVTEHFSKSSRLECVLAVDSIEKFLKFHRDFMEIKLVLLDVMLYNQSSIYSIPHILQREPEVEIIMFTVMDDSKTILQALSHGATGYILKDIDLEVLESSLLMVLEGRGALLSPAIAKKLVQYFVPPAPPQPDTEDTLTEKESIVLNMLKEGRTYQEISDRIGITVNGVRYYVKSVYRKFQVSNKGELIRRKLDLP